MWFRVDDDLHNHPKARKAGPAAMGLWVMAGSYCAKWGTDGHVPASFVAALGQPHVRRLAARLVESGLWEVNADGWVFRDWTDYQLTAEQYRTRQDANRERQRRHRDKGGGVW